MQTAIDDPKPSVLPTDSEDPKTAFQSLEQQETPGTTTKIYVFRASSGDAVGHRIDRITRAEDHISGAGPRQAFPVTLDLVRIHMRHLTLKP
jgi:hypothetical protein